MPDKRSSIQRLLPVLLSMPSSSFERQPIGHRLPPQAWNHALQPHSPELSMVRLMLTPHRLTLLQGTLLPCSVHPSSSARTDPSALEKTWMRLLTHGSWMNRALSLHVHPGLYCRRQSGSSKNSNTAKLEVAACSFIVAIVASCLYSPPGLSRPRGGCLLSLAHHRHLCISLSTRRPSTS